MVFPHAMANSPSACGADAVCEIHWFRTHRKHKERAAMSNSEIVEIERKIFELNARLNELRKVAQAKPVPN